MTKVIVTVLLSNVVWLLAGQPKVQSFSDPITLGLCRSKCDSMYPKPWESEHDSCIRRCENPPDTAGRSDSAKSTDQLHLSADPDAKDLGIKAQLNATKVNIATVGIFPNFRKEHNRVRASMDTEGLELLATYVYMKNSKWPKNCDLTDHGKVPADEWISIGPNHANGIGWSSSGPVIRNGNVVSVDFDNWSDCNRRGGKIVLYLR